MSDYSTCRTSRVLTRLVHQVRVYAFGAPTTRLRVWCTYKALTNQGEAHQYIEPVVCINTEDSHHRPKEHTILRVFRARGHDSLIPLNWYQQVQFGRLRTSTKFYYYFPPFSTYTVIYSNLWQSRAICLC